MSHFEPKHVAQSVVTDGIALIFSRVSQFIFVTAMVLLPLFFIPVIAAPFEYTKILLVVIATMVATMFYGFSLLRSGSVTWSAQWSLLVLWTIPVTALISAMFSGDFTDALIGESFATQSVLFVSLLAFVTTMSTLFFTKRRVIGRLYASLFGVVGILALYHIVRFIFGPEVLSFGLFTSPIATPLGSWNDLGLFFGGVVILALVALEQLRLNRLQAIFVLVTTVLSLAILAAVNFFAVWVVLGFVSLVTLMYTLSKDRFGNAAAQPATQKISLTSIAAAILVFVVSLTFLIGGTAVSGAVSNLTNISYIEVRPSLSATADIARGVYEENVLTGIGPNKFIDAWRLYKSEDINQTTFWATDFASGNGYVTTLLATTGVLGLVAWFAFMVSYLWAGVRMLFVTTNKDRTLYFIATSAFLASVYFWLMSFIYVPSATILILTALFTGVTFSAHALLIPSTAHTFVFGTNKRTGVALVMLVILLIIVAMSMMYTIGRHYSAAYTFTESLTNITADTTLEAVEQSVSNAYALSENDVYAREVASYQILRMNSLLGVAEPTSEQQQAFQAAVTNGVSIAQLAVDIDATDAQNWATLAVVYSNATAAGIEGAYDRAKETFATARSLDPHNPAHILAEAQLESRNNDLEAARALTTEAIELRPQYIDAILFLSQLEVLAGNLPAAIATTLATVQLEPQNPSRLYQLGVLYSSNNEIQNAIAAYEQAVILDPSFANARYLLALAYLEVDRSADALAQLQVVAELNPNNEELAALVRQVAAGEGVSDVPTAIESDAVIVDGEQVQTDVLPDSDLISSVNGGVEEVGVSVSEDADDTTESETETE